MCAPYGVMAMKDEKSSNVGVITTHETSKIFIFLSNFFLIQQKFFFLLTKIYLYQVEAYQPQTQQ